MHSHGPGEPEQLVLSERLCVRQCFHHLGVLPDSEATRLTQHLYQLPVLSGCHLGSVSTHATVLINVFRPLLDVRNDVS